MTPEPAIIYMGDDSPLVRATLADALSSEGVQVHVPGGAGTNDATSFIGGFRCAILDLEQVAGTDDAIDVAELLRVYQPALPVAFLHESASQKMIRRAEALGPVFRKPDDLAAALAWVRDLAAA